MSDVADRVSPAAAGDADQPGPGQNAPPNSSRLAAFLPTVLTVAFAAGYAIFFCWLSLEQYWAYQSHALDLGNMSQAAWNTIHGHPFYFTNMRLNYFGIEAWGTTTRLSFHVEALFPVISLVYLIYPHPESLLALQSLAIATGAVPVYLLARDLLRSAWVGLVFAVAYLLSPTLEGMNLYEFHPVALATPLLLWAFLFLWRRQTVPFWICALAAMGTKEEIGLVVALFGLFAAFFRGQRVSGLALAAIGVIWSFFAAAVVEPHFRVAGTKTYLQSRYGYLLYTPPGGKREHGLHAVLDTLRHDPGVIPRTLFIWPKLGYLERLLAPAGYLALLAPLMLLLGAPTLILNLFSTDFHMYSGLGDNSAEVLSVVMIASIFGAALVSRILSGRLSRRWAFILVGLYVLAQAFWSQHVDGFTPLGGAFQRPVIGAHQHLADKFVSMIPPSAPVSTQDQLDPHLSSRHYVYLFEDTGREQPGVPPARYVLLDASAPTYPLPSWQLHDRAQSLLHHGWGIAAAQDGLILLEPGLRRRTPPAAFYTYARAESVRIPDLLRARSGPLEVLGYSRQETDRSNHPIPNLAYTFYFRPVAHPGMNLQPVLFESMGGRLIGCSRDPLGLAWYPTTQWQPGQTYQVKMAPLETAWDDAGTAHLTMELLPESVGSSDNQNCATLWKSHAQLYAVGTLDLSL
jgi:uncharacterized membrane protein